MNTDFFTKEVRALIKDYCEFEQLKLPTWNKHPRSTIIRHLKKVFLQIEPLFPSADLVIQKAITVLFSEFLFSIEQVKFGSGQLELKKDMYDGVDDLLRLLKIQEESPFNISKVSFQLRDGGSFIGDDETGDSLSKKIQDGNLKPETISVHGSIIINAILSGIQTQGDLLDEYSINAKQTFFNLDKPAKDPVEFAKQNNLKPLYSFIVDNNVLKSKNAALSKIVDVLSGFDLIRYDASDKACQKKAFIKRLDRALSK
jgi:hypothetical protein|tara:strand:- start:1576 stop:2346 length:771 start_codon:yes stop_codon:yes gene_type:complete